MSPDEHCQSEEVRPEERSNCTRNADCCISESGDTEI